MVLLTSAVAEVSKDRYRIVGGSYTADGDNLEFGLNLALDKSPNGKFVGHVDTFIVDSRQGTFRVLTNLQIICEVADGLEAVRPRPQVLLAHCAAKRALVRRFCAALYT
jgi:hypothetical protein